MVTSTTQAVTGDINSGHVSLSLEGANQVFGTFSGGVLHLNVPNQDGTLEAHTFSLVSPTTFNQVVQKLQLRVHNDNQTAAVQAAIDKAAKQVVNNMAALDQTDFTIDVGNVSGNAQDVQSNLQSAQINMQDYDSNATSNDACTQAASVADGAQGANDALSFLASNVQELGSDMGTIKQFMLTAQNDPTAYHRAQSRLPGSKRQLQWAT